MNLCCIYSTITSCNWILQLAQTYEMEFFETSASTSSNIREVGQTIHLQRNSQEYVLILCGTFRDFLLYLPLEILSFFLLPPVIHSFDRTGAAGSQERCGQLVGIPGWLSRKSCSGGREEGSRYWWKRSEELWLLTKSHMTDTGCLFPAATLCDPA